jgi:hypothetical protein
MDFAETLEGRMDLQKREGGCFNFFAMSSSRPML